MGEFYTTQAGGVHCQLSRKRITPGCAGPLTQLLDPESTTSYSTRARREDIAAQVAARAVRLMVNQPRSIGKRS